jgi:hypothetical protein
MHDPIVWLWPSMRRGVLCILCLLAASYLTACIAPPDRVPAAGELGGQKVDTTVDSQIARYYLEQYLAGDKTNAALHARIRSLEQKITGKGLNRARLQDISQHFSTDFATLLFARHVLREAPNRGLHRAFRREFERLLGLVKQEKPLPKADPSEYVLLFAPGWLYVTTDSGADFARQRETLSRMGYHTHLIKVDEHGSVEANAAFIAEAVRRFSRQRRDIILVSVSKGGPEAAYALGYLLAPEESRRVKAWINVGGLLRGTPLADPAFRWPKSWIASAYFRYQGWQLSAIEGLTTHRSEARLRQINLPDSIQVINYVGAPLSGQVLPGRTYKNYLTLRALGPNDGLTLLIDELALGGITLVELGLDHYFLDPLLDLKTAALARVVIARLEQASAAIP